MLHSLTPESIAAMPARPVRSTDGQNEQIAARRAWGLPSGCARCGAGPSRDKRGRSLIVWHHPDYTQPTAVIGLCRPCHAKTHVGTIPEPVTGRWWPRECGLTTPEIDAKARAYAASLTAPVRRPHRDPVFQHAIRLGLLSMTGKASLVRYHAVTP